MMTLTDSHRQRATIIGRRTWFFTGITLVVMGMVAIAAGLVLQQKLHRSKCNESNNDDFQSLNIKLSIWCGIPIAFYGLLTIAVGIYQNKAMMMIQALFSVLFTLLALTLLLISEVNIVSNYSHSMPFNGSGIEANADPQPMAAQHGDPFLRFSPSDRNTPRADHGTKLDGKSSIMNSNNNDHNVNYQHEPGVYSGHRLQAGTLPDNTEERGHEMDQDLLDQRFSEGKADNTEDTSDEYSGFGQGFVEYEDNFFERAADEERVKEEYDLIDYDLGEGLGNKTAEESSRHGISMDWHEDNVSWTRKKRDLREDCPKEEDIARQWLFQLMSCLMAVVGFVVLVLSIVIATLIFAPFCCYQTDAMANAQTSSRMQSATSAAVAGKDDSSLWSDDATLLPA